MDSRFYEVNLPYHKIFVDLKESLSENPSRKLRNLLDLKDDVFYVWNSVENCLLCLNLKQLEENGQETPYQKLHFLSPPCFSVDRVMVSGCGSRVCVWGSRGVTVAELPSRWGRGGLFESGSQTVLCKSFTLDERFLYMQGEVCRVHWHPKSLSHLLVLVSDNTIRLYNIALRTGPKLVKIHTIGQKPTSLLAGKTILDSLGDTAVDFTPTPDFEHYLILRGDGEVYMMECDIDEKSLKPKLTGPLSIYPPADDNYGSESCSIVALGGGDLPPVVVIATCSATLYHCLLLPNCAENEPNDGDSHALYVVEMVELNMVLNPDDNALHSSYPVHLYQCTNSTYACVHAGGVHTVAMPMLGQLLDYALADEGDHETALSAVGSRASVARHLVCTSDSSESLCPPVGIVLTQPPLPKLLVLCADANLLTRTLEPYDTEDQLYKEIQLKNPALDQEDVNNLLKQRQKLTFTAIIQEILTRNSSQPILNINKKDEPGPQEALELVSQACLKLRGEYISRQERAGEAVAMKLHALKTLALRQRDWLSELQKEIENVHIQSMVLKEKCLVADKRQEDIKHRCSAVIRAMRAATAASPAERELLAELERYRRSGDRYAEQIALLQQHARRNSEELKIWQNEYKKKDIALGKSHSDTISSILQQQTSQISTLIEETKLLKDQLSIV